MDQFDEFRKRAGRIRSYSPPPQELAPGPPGSARAEGLDAIERVQVEQAAIEEVFPWFKTPRGKLALWALGVFVTGGGLTAFRGPIRDWLDVVSVPAWQAADDAKAKTIAELSEKVSDLRQKEAARATEEERRRADEKLRVLEEQNRALQDEVRRAYKRNPDRAPVVMMPAEP